MTKATDIRQEDIYSREAEAGVLGSLIIASKTEPARIGDIMGTLAVEDFYLPENQAVYRAVIDIYIETSIMDPIVLRERLKQGNQLEEVGGTDTYIIELVETVTCEVNLDYFVEIVKRKSRNREVIRTAESISNEAINSKPMEEKVERIQELALNLSSIDSRSDVYKVEDLVEDSLAGLLENRSGIKTGFDKLDWHTGGLHRGDMVIVAARPSMGKTAFATDLALNMARAGKSIVIYSLEMTRIQLVQRMLCNVARVDSHKVQRKDYTPEETNELASAAGTLAEYKIFIMNFSQLTPEAFNGSLKTVKSRFGVNCVMIDYLQLMSVRGRSESRQQQITSISRALKATARDDEVPVIVLSQLNREVEHRVNHKPKLADLRESGSIEQDADVVILLHRPDWYHRGESATMYTPTGNGVFQVAKNRNGPTGELELQFNEQYVSFGNLTKIEEQQCFGGQER